MAKAGSAPDERFLHLRQTCAWCWTNDMVLTARRYPNQPLRAIYDVAAPAKLNLFLHITGQRPDGYHLIQSVFMLIDWCDTLHFELRADGKISREDLTDGDPLQSAHPAQLPADDLTVRAARALQQACGTSLGVHIGLNKRIPSQAGMGGGSSDAASCLLALQRLWGVCLAPDELQKLSLSLGADVPFFLSGGHAWVEGIGEKITPVSLPRAAFVVVKSPAGVSTRDIFNAPDLRRNSGTATIQGFAANANSDKNSLMEFGQNDLQPVAMRMCPQIGQSLDWLAAQQLHGRMTGSGSAVFAQLPHSADLTSPPSGWRVRKCSSLEMHPLAGW